MRAVSGVDLEIEPHSIVALIGPSGCGKSTLLNMIAGLYPPSEGRVVYQGGQVSDVNTDVGYMTQKDNLLPWRTVLDNVALPLELAGQPQAKRYEAARAMIRQVGLDGFENKYSGELSGGMRKRACLARMLLYEPKALLLDEPFAALDAQLRIAMHDLLLRCGPPTSRPSCSSPTIWSRPSRWPTASSCSAAVPARVAHEQLIDLPRPRDVAQVRFTERFHEIYNAIWEKLREEYVEEKL